MLLPCPECQTVYNAEPSVYKPGMAFQCVSCGAVVVVPTEIEAADAEAAEQSEPDSSEPLVDPSLQSGEPEAATPSEVEQSESFDFDLDLPLPAGDEEPQPTMVFDASSLEQAVSDAFGPSESPGEDSRASAEISDDFFDAPDDSSGLESMPAAFSLDPSEDGLATRQLDAGNLEVSAPEASGLPDLNLDALDQPTMVLPSREIEPKGDEPAADGAATRVLSAGNSESGLDAVDLLDDLFDGSESIPDLSGASLPHADAIESPAPSGGENGFDLTDDVFGDGAASSVPIESAGTDSDVGDDSGLAALDFDDLVNQPLGSDDVSFSFDELSSVDTRGESHSSEGAARSSETSQPATQVLTDSSGETDEASSSAQPTGDSEAKPSHTWLGLGLVVVSLALIVSTVDIATLLDGGLGSDTDAVSKQPPASPKAEASDQAPQGTSVVSDTKVTIDSAAAIFDLDYAGLIRTVETKSTTPALKALAEYRLSRFFGESKRLSDASEWLQGFTATESTTKLETVTALTIGAVISEQMKAARDSAELLLAKKVELDAVEKALVASALSGPKQRPASIQLFKDVLKDAPTRVELWHLFLDQHNDRNAQTWAAETLRSFDSKLNEWQQARYLDLFLKIGKPSLVIAMILGQTPGDASAPVNYAAGDKLLVARLRGVQGVLKGDLADWRTFVTQQAKARPNLENFIARARASSLLDGKISLALTERARSEKAPVVQARLYYEAALLGRDLALEKETAALVKEMVQSLSPTKTGGYFQLARGELALLMGNRGLAKRFINASLKINPRLTEASLASLMLIDRDKDIFLRELSKLHQRGDSPRVAWQLARVFSERNNHGGAIRLIEALLVETPTVAPVSTLLLSLLDNLVANGSYERLSQISESLYAVNPKDTELVTLIVEALDPAVSKDFPDQPIARVKWTERLHKLDPSNRDNLYLWVEALLDAEKQREARDVLKALLDEFPDARGTAKFTQLLARTWIGENPSEARQFLKESIRLERMPTSHVLLGEIEEQRQSQVDAIEQYLLAIELEPTMTDIRFRVGRLLYDVGRYPEASSQLEVVVNTNPANVVARELLGDTFREQGMAERALRQYRRVLEQGNVREALFMKTARLQMYDLNRLEEAVRSLQEAALLNDKNSEILYLLGVALKDLNQLERARRQFQKYLRLDPNGDYAEEVRGILKNL